MINQILLTKIKNIDSKYSRKNGKARSIEFGKVISDTLLKEEYVNKNKSLNDLGRELGVTSSYLSKRLREINLLRNRSDSCKNELNPRWTGDDISYNGVHLWVRRRKPKPNLCVNCNKAKPKDLANISGEYKRDVNDYKWLCRKCHMEEDGRRERLIERIIKQNKDPIFIQKVH
jgi:hypothetical protein